MLASWFCQDSTSSTSSDSNFEIPEAAVPEALAELCQPCEPVSRPAAEDIIHLDAGIIRYYTYKVGKPFLVAHCSNRTHGKKCRRTKICIASADPLRAGQGRPLGFLVWWLENHHLPYKDHCALVRGTESDFVERRLARARLLRHPKGPIFATKVERARNPHEPEEPINVP